VDQAGVIQLFNSYIFLLQNFHDLSDSKMTKKPSGVEDWHERLLQATEARYTEYHLKNNRNKAKQWKDALNMLNRSRVKIRIPKSGANKGLVLGFPKGMNPAVVQVLTRIVNHEEDVLLPEHEGLRSISVTDEHVVRGRNYRDSAYAILASLYLEYQGPGVNPQPTIVAQRRAARFTDAVMEYDFRTGTHGAW